jgi:hypothetical protein
MFAAGGKAACSVAKIIGNNVAGIFSDLVLRENGR